MKTRRQKRLLKYTIKQVKNKTIRYKGGYEDDGHSSNDDDHNDDDDLDDMNPNLIQYIDNLILSSNNMVVESNQLFVSIETNRKITENQLRILQRISKRINRLESDLLNLKGFRVHHNRMRLFKQCLSNLKNQVNMINYRISNMFINKRKR